MIANLYFTVENQVLWVLSEPNGCAYRLIQDLVECEHFEEGRNPVIGRQMYF